MKGLTLSNLQRKDEAFELARAGLRKAPRSSICWHVLGLLHRAEKQLEEAAKAYTMACRLDADNVTILRDLSYMQVQLRKLDDYQESRRKLLTLRPKVGQNWVSFAVACHLAGDHNRAVAVLEEFEKTIAIGQKPGYDASGRALLRLRILNKLGDVDRQLAYLDSAKRVVKDKLGWQQSRGWLMVQLQRWEEAEGIFDELIHINPECYDYHRGWQAAFLRSSVGSTQTRCELPAAVCELDDDTYARLLAHYDALAAEFPRAGAMRRIPLDFARGDDLLARLDAFLRRGLRKAVPNLFSEVKPWYGKRRAAVSDDASPADDAPLSPQQAAVEQLLCGYAAALEGDSAVLPPLAGSGAATAAAAAAAVEGAAAASKLRSLLLRMNSS
eukprot:PLAT3310.4.p1 GENE.PLAT3310.4~~PLAT3310.4.p1  ORF type:complete len:451 (-),score=257.60 PLAT3310.4:824-1978(-)